MGTPEEVRFWAYRVSQMVAESELECIRILTKQIRNDLGASRHHVRVLADTARLRATLIKQLDGDWEKILNEAQQVLNQAAEAGQADARMDIVEAFNRTPVPVSDQTLNAITMLARETSSVLMQAPALILRDVLDHYREFMSQPVTNVVMGASTTRQALQQALGNYAHNGITTFQDKSGRFWRIDSYAEMAVRTGAAHAMRYGYQQTAIANGFDLVQVTGNTYTCDKCGPWQGKVLSIDTRVQAGTHVYPHAVTGELVTVHVAGTLEQARSEGLFHPNCTHHVGAYLPGVTSLPSAGIEEDLATYEASQKQRALEREIRKLKREQIAVLDGTDGSKAREIRKYQKELRELLAEYPKLQRQYYRETTPTEYPHPAKRWKLSDRLPANLKGNGATRSISLVPTGQQKIVSPFRNIVREVSDPAKRDDLLQRADRMSKVQSDLSKLKDTSGAWMRDQVLEMHEIEFLERFERLGHRVQWIPRAMPAKGAGRKSTHDFVWLNNDELLIELKKATDSYSTIKESIRNAVNKATRHGVTKDCFIVNLQSYSLNKKLRQQLMAYNQRVSTGKIRRLFVMSENGLRFEEIILK